MVYHGPNQGVTMYINGALESTTSTMYAFGLNAGNGKMVIGRRETNKDSLYASFIIDELTLWSNELTAQEVQDLYQAYQ